MSRRHEFHTDHTGHSITVTVRAGPSRALELLVDGKEVAHRDHLGAGTTLLSAELPGQPPVPFRVAVHQPRFGSCVPHCSLLIAGAQDPLPERAVA